MTNLTALIAAADEAMYAAKHKGRLMRICNASVARVRPADGGRLP